MSVSYGCETLGMASSILLTLIFGGLLFLIAGSNIIFKNNADTSSNIASSIVKKEVRGDRDQNHSNSHINDGGDSTGSLRDTTNIDNTHAVGASSSWSTCITTSSVVAAAISYVLTIFIFTLLCC